MRLYYMTSHAVATEHIIPERRMKLSLFDDLNDPFELRPYALSSAELRVVAKALHSSISERKGLTCFTDNWVSPVMWAHYADKHKGVCLGFDIPHEPPNELVHPVSYSIDRLKLVLDSARPLMGLDQDIYRTVVYTKSSEWAYEREWRAIANLRIADPVTGYHYVDFGPDLQLREVILGARNETPVGQVAKLIKFNEASVTVLKARPAFHEFAMVQNKAVKPIRVRARR